MVLLMPTVSLERKRYTCCILRWLKLCSAMYKQMVPSRMQCNHQTSVLYMRLSNYPAIVPLRRKKNYTSYIGGTLKHPLTLGTVSRISEPRCCRQRQPRHRRIVQKLILTYLMCCRKCRSSVRICSIWRLKENPSFPRAVVKVGKSLQWWVKGGSLGCRSRKRDAECWKRLWCRTFYSPGTDAMQ